MKKKTIIIAAVAVIAAAAIAVAVVKARGEKPLEVQTAEAGLQQVVQKVNATGKVQPKTQVKISADVSARIMRLGVKEGDRVEQGQFLVELDREAYLAAVESAQANVRSAEATAKLVQESMLQAEREFKRAAEIVRLKLDSQARLDEAEAAYKVEVARYEAALGDAARARASLKQSKDSLSKTSIYAPMAGVITELRREQGEIAIGSQFQEDVILVISDMSEMEVQLDVDENDIVAVALGRLGVPRKRAAVILFIVAGLSAAAPPVNIWAMILCAGTAIPYVGFELTLGIPVLLLGAFTVLVLGRRGDGRAAPAGAVEAPEPPKGMSWWRVLLPFAVFFGLVVASRAWPFALPVLGLPLQFVAAGATALVLSPRRIPLAALARDTAKRLRPLLATVVVVGVLQQVMTATGVRGLVSFAVISTPLVLLFLLLPVIIPVSEGVLTYGAAAVIGIPLIWFLDSIGYHATVVIAGLSLLWPLGDGLPPTALIGRLSNMVSGYDGSYREFLKAAWLPWLVVTAAAMAMILFSSKLAFLVRWSM